MVAAAYSAQETKNKKNNFCLPKTNTRNRESQLICGVNDFKSVLNKNRHFRASARARPSLRVIHQKVWLQFLLEFLASHKPEATLHFPLLCGFLWPEIVLQFAFQICSLLGPGAAAQSPLQVLREFPLQFLREFLLRFFLIRNCNKTKS